jgi:hypothetical protein
MPGYNTQPGQMTAAQAWALQQQQQQAQGGQGYYQYHHTSGQPRNQQQGFYDGVWPGFNGDFE